MNWRLCAFSNKSLAQIKVFFSYANSCKKIVNPNEKKTESSATAWELGNLTRGKLQRKWSYFIHSFLQVLDEDDIFIHSFRPQDFRMGVQADQPQLDLAVALEGCEGI